MDKYIVIRLPLYYHFIILKINWKNKLFDVKKYIFTLKHPFRFKLPSYTCGYRTHLVISIPSGLQDSSGRVINT